MVKAVNLTDSIQNREALSLGDDCSVRMTSKHRELFRIFFIILCVSKNAISK